MIKISEDSIRKLEQSYPGITEQIQHFEALELPACPVCGSDDTASVQVGMIGRTINLCGATSKFHLIPNGNDKGIYYCNDCRQQFGPSRRQENNPPGQSDKDRPIFLRPVDDSWEAYRNWVLSLTSAMTGQQADDYYTEENWKQLANEFWSKSDKELDGSL